MSSLLLLVAVVLFVVAAVLAWPSHAVAAACIGLACFAGSFLVGALPALPPR